MMCGMLVIWCMLVICSVIVEICGLVVMLMVMWCDVVEIDGFDGNVCCVSYMCYPTDSGNILHGVVIVV